MVTTAQRWIAEIDASEKDSAHWMKRCREIIRRYRDERDRNYDNPNYRRFAILWSNVETIGPAIYARPPKPMVTRRFNDKDPVAKAAGEILERSLAYGIDENDFDLFMVNARLDYLLTGRGQAWVRYVPTMETVEPETDPDTDEEAPEAAEPYERVTYEEWKVDHVLWDDFLTNPCRTWQEVRWVGRIVRMTRGELVKRFTNPSNIEGKTIGEVVPLDWAPKGYRQKDPETDEVVKKACVYEIWDKASRKAYWISKSYPLPLDEREDPLKLKNFWPCPRPLFATIASDSIIPTPDYYLYQDQAEELNQLTARIGRLIDSLRLNGVYAGEAKLDLQRLLDTSNENRLIPVEDWAAFQDKGGMKGIIEWVPLDMVVATLQACFEAREKVMNDIYQITGLSDIIRGATDPNETATAQGLKSQWGSLRVRDRQKEIQRFACEILNIAAEIVAKFYSQDTLAKLTGEKLFLDQMQKDQVQQQLAMQAQMAQQAGQEPPQPPPEVQVMLGAPTWEEVMALLRDDAMRCFRIDVETDSTIEPDRMEEKANATEFLSTLGSFINQVGPAVQADPRIGPVLGEALLYLVRRMDVGRSMEEIVERTFEEMLNSPAPQQGEGAGDPNALGVAQLELQIEQTKTEGAIKLQQLKMQQSQAEMPFKIQELQLKTSAMLRDPQPQAVGVA